jgi:hypothetical protein
MGPAGLSPVQPFVIPEQLPPEAVLQVERSRQRQRANDLRHGPGEGTEPMAGTPASACDGQGLHLNPILHF